MLFSSVIPLQVSDAQSNTSVTGPWCNFQGFVPPIYNGVAFVNVTSNVPVHNATLYYVVRSLSANGPITNWNNASIYASSPMELNTQYGGNRSRYAYQFPHEPNDTQTFGYVKFVDAKGDVFYSGGQPYPLPICAYFWPTPGAKLDIEMFVQDINPQHLNLNASFTADLYNSETFNGISIEGPGFYYPVYQLQGSNLDYWMGNHTYVSLGYYGLAQLFPIDSYTYQVDLYLSQRLNYTEVTLNNHQLGPNATVSGVVGFTNSPTFSQSSDIGDWNMTSTAQFLPKQGVIIITMQTTRLLGQVSDYILIPLLSVYALLGLSILLTRKGDLANRLVLYLTIFLFSFELDSFIRSLVVSPFALGPTMADLLVLALIPCTSFLAGASIVAWIPRFYRWRTYIDLAGIGGALSILLLEVQFVTKQYVSTSTGFQLKNVTYWLNDLGPWGRGIALALASGAIALLAIHAFDKVRTKKAWLGDEHS